MMEKLRNDSDQTRKACIWMPQTESTECAVRAGTALSEVAAERSPWSIRSSLIEWSSLVRRSGARRGAGNWWLRCMCCGCDAWRSWRVNEILRNAIPRAARPAPSPDEAGDSVAVVEALDHVGAGYACRRGGGWSETGWPQRPCRNGGASLRVRAAVRCAAAMGEPGPHAEWANATKRAGDSYGEWFFIALAAIDDAKIRTHHA